MFKVGDRIKVRSGWGLSSAGELGTVTSTKLMDVQDDTSYVGVLLDSGLAHDFFLRELQPASQGKRGRPRVKPAPVNFLLKYDLDEDPIEEFETMEQVKERIKELAKRSDLKRDSIVIYEVKKKRTVTIETKINIK